jgi:hypothetical protein
METEILIRKRLDGLPQGSGYDSAEFWAPPVAPIETSPPANTEASHCVSTLYYEDENDPLQHNDFSKRSVGSSRKLITGIAVVLALGLCALAYFFLASPSDKTTTQIAELASSVAELAPSVPYPPATPAEAISSVVPAVANPSVAPAPATASAAPAAAALPPWAIPEPVQAPPKVAQSGPVLYLQRPGVNIRSTPSPTGTAVGTAPKGTGFKVTKRQGDWIQVERGPLKGWINAGFLAPTEPR